MNRKKEIDHKIERILNNCFKDLDDNDYCNFTNLMIYIDYLFDNGLESLSIEYKIKDELHAFSGKHLGNVNDLLKPLYELTNDKYLLSTIDVCLFKCKDIVINKDTGFHFPFSPVTNKDIKDFFINNKDIFYNLDDQKVINKTEHRFYKDNGMTY